MSNTVSLTIFVVSKQYRGDRSNQLNSSGSPVCLRVCVCVCCLQWNCVCTMTLLLSRQMNLLKQELHQFCAFELDSQLNVQAMQMCGWWKKVFQFEFYFVQFINHNTYYVWRNFRIKMWHYSIFVLYRQSSCCSENQFHWLLYHNEQNQLN